MVPCSSISYLVVASTPILLQCENSLSQIFLFWKHLCTKVLLASHRNYLKGISCSLPTGLVTDTTFFSLLAPDCVPIFLKAIYIAELRESSASQRALKSMRPTNGSHCKILCENNILFGFW